MAGHGGCEFISAQGSFLRSPLKESGFAQPLRQNTIQQRAGQYRCSDYHNPSANAVNLALSGAMDGRIVNISDEAPTSVYELLQLVGETMESLSEPLSNPWYLHVDGSLARRLGFQPRVRSVHQAMAEKLL